MRTSDTIGELAAALAKAQAEMSNAAKDSKNPHFRSAFASLEAVRAATLPALTAHGIALVQGLSSSERGDLVCSTMLMHSSGEWVASDFAVKPTKSDPQGMGSAATYARRYALMAMCGIAPTDDDDGNAASRPVERAQSRQEPTRKWSPQEQRHHPSWVASKAGFFAALGDVCGDWKPPKGVKPYDALKALCADLGRSKPSAMDDAQRHKLLAWLATEPGWDRFTAKALELVEAA